MPILQFEQISMKGLLISIRPFKTLVRFRANGQLFLINAIIIQSIFAVELVEVEQGLNSKGPEKLVATNVIWIFGQKFKQLDGKSLPIVEYCLLILSNVGADLDQAAAEFNRSNIWKASQSTGVKYCYFLIHSMLQKTTGFNGNLVSWLHTRVHFAVDLRLHQAHKNCTQRANPPGVGLIRHHMTCVNPTFGKVRQTWF